MQLFLIKSKLWHVSKSHDPKDDFTVVTYPPSDQA